MKSRFDTFTGGMLKVCEPPNEVSDFNAVKNVTSADNLTVLYTLAFDEMSRREKDVEFAQTAGHTLDLKVKVRYLKDIDTSKRVLIGKKLYSVYEADYSTDKTVLFLYLELEREL